MNLWIDAGNDGYRWDDVPDDYADLLLAYAVVLFGKPDTIA